MMMTATDLALILASGLAAGFINALSGGGAMLTLPVLIFIGLPPSVANGTNRLAVVVQCLASTAAYHRLGVIDYRLVWSVAVPTTIGGLCGALVSVRLDDALFRTILAITMLLLLGPIIAESKLKERAARRAQQLQSGWLMWGVFFALGVYGGLLQVGVGVFLLVALSTFGGIDLVAANGAKVVLVLCLTLLALLVFLAEGKVDWHAGLVMASANAVGSWFGAYWGVRKGDYWIRVVLVGTVIVMALQLLGIPGWIVERLQRL
jgi:uncharacterized protein